MLHFLALGACLFALVRLVDGQRASPELAPLEISSERVAALRRDLAGRLGRAPDSAELAAALEVEVADELLLREARRRGLARRDPVVRARLVENMRFLSGEAEPDALYAEALAIGLDRNDLVVRRRLIQRMRHRLEQEARTVEPDEAELRAHYERSRERFRAEPAARLSHVFFDPARRGARAEADAGAALATGEPGPGDPFLAPRDLPWLARRGLATWFGEAFAGSVFELPVGAWSGPLRSAHGLHLVRVHERRAAEVAPFEEVREQVRLLLLAERGEQAVRDAVLRWRARQPVVFGNGG
jgi:parvulin-like peptidyl-prolyl isomerase